MGCSWVPVARGQLLSAIAGKKPSPSVCWQRCRCWLFFPQNEPFPFSLVEGGKQGERRGGSGEAGAHRWEMLGALRRAQSQRVCDAWGGCPGLCPPSFISRRGCLACLPLWGNLGSSCWWRGRCEIGWQNAFFCCWQPRWGRWMPEKEIRLSAVRASPFTSMGNGRCKTPCPKPQGLQAARRSMIIAEKLHFFER